MDENIYFSSSSNDTSASSSDEARFASSRSASVLPSAAQLTQSPPKDYWFGNKYFECVLAQDLLLLTAVQEPASAIDSKLSDAARDFPFSQCLEYLHSRDVGNNKNLSDTNLDHRQALLSQIGMVVRQGSGKEKRLILRAIRKFKVGKSIKAQRKDTPSDISRFTILLHEYGTHFGETPKYTSEVLSYDPPLFKQQVKLCRVKGEGTGRKMRTAKHQASREACKRLGLKVD